MLRTLGLFAFFVALCCSPLAAESDRLSARKHKEISINALQLFNGILPVNFRFAVSPKIAFGISPHARFVSWGNTKFYGGGVGLSCKFFLNGYAIDDSWYLEPALTFGYSAYTGTGFWSMTPSIVGGHTWVWNSGFIINAGLGLAFAVPFTGTAGLDYSNSFGVKGIMPAFDLSLGYAW
jgi:hypothetical protein